MSLRSPVTKHEKEEEDRDWQALAGLGCFRFRRWEQAEGGRGKEREEDAASEEEEEATAAARPMPAGTEERSDTDDMAECQERTALVWTGATISTGETLFRSLDCKSTCRLSRR
jgi:hypothetical protein